MKETVYSNLKTILDERGISIRELSRMTDYRMESVRQMYNDTMERYPREMIYRICKVLDVRPCDLIKFGEKDGLSE